MNRPKISIITPSYNQGDFLEQCFQSIHSQGYPNLQHIVMDGGSTDDSLKIVKAYEDRLAYWESAKDGGQPNALNRGLRLCEGEIVGWLNSDDLYKPGIFNFVAEQYSKCDNKEGFWISTGCEWRDEIEQTTHDGFVEECFSIDEWVYGNRSMDQQGMFFARAFFEKYGGFREDLHYGFDKELYIRLIANGERYEICRDIVGGVYRIHEKSKWGSERGSFKYDWARISLEYVDRCEMYDEARIRQFKEIICQWHLAEASRSANSTGFVRCLGNAIRVNPKIVLTRQCVGAIARRLVPGLRPT